MRKILITTLLLGCLVVVVTPARNGFEFFDSHGRCWRCLPGESCISCPSSRMPRPFWDRTCPTPTAEMCRNSPIQRLPSNWARFYYQCGDDGSFVRVECPCDLIFDANKQDCVGIFDPDLSISCDAYENSFNCNCDPVEPCEQPPPLSPPGPGPDETTEDPNETTADPNETTTEDPDETTAEETTSESTTVSTTGPPCVCVVWWPCWCNPCWNMPCHSCNGCVGMMG